ncbi:ABC transporter ATP-binding protein [Parablautia intestinalis]|jgi:ATP-binding cassette subfamily B protein|uniref:ABC transporter ATP-binding protein n=1 Tax=Parablautia intestinalis TaxID=2320100 RepID=UPI0023C1ABF1|nr:ABC transporter ATP-binding protein [Parablautia intestinalis]MCI8615206.1 ABC transporter ATP-binding protein [Lachnospiraceae bacterium]MDE7047479.1 ABC transporter ATP-binding protein/permease [Lachnospiraceae bacterium]
MNQAEKGKWKKFISYYKPYKKIFVSDMFFACIGAAVTLIIPLIIRYITSDVIYRNSSESLKTILMLTGIMVVLIILECYCNYFIAYYGHIMGAKMEYNMRNEIFSHYQKLSFSFFDNQKVGQLMSRVTNDLFEISELFHHGPEDIVISIIKLFGSFSILLSINWRLALTAFAIVPVMLLYAFYFNIKMKRAFVKNRARIADINAQIEDNLSGIRVVKSFANEEIEMDKFKVGNDRFVESKKESYKYMGLYHSGLGAFTTLISVIVIALGAVFITTDIISITDLITFLLYINNFTEPIKKLINFTEQFQNGASGYTRFLEILDINPDITDKPDAKELVNAKGDIIFDDVSFHYEEHSETVLSNLNLHVKEGEYIALVGTSGVGKSTLCSLIPRFYDVSSGCIRIDGTDIRDYTLKSLRNNIGIVQQDVYLFTGSVMDNIRYGRPGATDAEIVAAAQNANAHEFIMNLPEGYDTNIGQRGIKLSGGQKQRLSIARVFLKNPPILIFDEATSALDNESEKVVQESLEKLAKNRTTFVIAHRLSTIRNAEKILVLSGNGIAESGNHQQLLAKNGIYAELYNMQFKVKN